LTPAPSAPPRRGPTPSGKPSPGRGPRGLAPPASCFQRLYPSVFPLLVRNMKWQYSLASTASPSPMLIPCHCQRAPETKESPPRRNRGTSRGTVRGTQRDTNTPPGWITEPRLPHGGVLKAFGKTPHSILAIQPVPSRYRIESTCPYRYHPCS
jgi:hypothetical protein